MKLEINGKDLGLEIVKVTDNFRDDRLEITTSGGEELFLNGEDSVDETPDQTPDKPSPTIPDGVVLGYHVTGSEVRGRNVVVPKGKTLSSRFTPTKSGSINIQRLNRGSVPKMDMWVSEEPGGDPVSNHCSTNGFGFVRTLEIHVGSGGFSWSCSLDTNKEYYINLKHQDPEIEDSVAERKIY